MAGELVGDSVVINDQAEASQIYNKGFYGYPQSGGGLELDLLEAIFLMEADRLVVQRQGENVRLEALLHAASEHCEGFEILYIVYRDLRQRGYVVKSDAGEFDFRVFPRGGTPSNAPTKYYVLAISERAACVMRDLFEEADRSERTRKELLLAVVDEEGDLTYYRASTGAPHGNPLAVPTTEIDASLFEDRVMVMDEAKGAELYSQGFFGKKIGKTLQLSLIETAYLMEQGVINIHYPISGKRMTLGAFR